MSFRFVPRVYPVPLPRLPGLLRALRDRAGLVALDSASGTPRDFSLVAADPLVGVGPWSSLDELRQALAALEVRPADELSGPFAGGFLGALAYELGVRGESLALPEPAWPGARIVGGLYVDFLCIDHAAGRAQLVLGEEPGDGRAGLEARREEWLRAIECSLSEVECEGSLHGAGPLVSHVSAADHEARIERARELIAAGEIYQVNLARRFTRALDAHPIDLYLRLRRLNPAPYMAYLHWREQGPDPAGERALLSASPELLLEFEGGEASTRPIKGTAVRERDPARDRAARERLMGSEKERAELAMIVDLERNDLGRVAVPGGVRVGEFPRLESFATVHHLVADVRAHCRPELDALDVLESLFPGGSISGAPKLRSMEVIAELEREGRGFFSGSLGFLDLRGRARFNILIRTLCWRARCAATAGEALPPSSSAERAGATRGELSFHVGGGITWKSCAAEEELETRWKGAALAAACSAPGEPCETLGVGLPAGADASGAARE